MKTTKLLTIMAIVILAISCKKENQVSTKPVAAFEIDQESQLDPGAGIPIEYNFTNTSRNATNIRWNFGTEYSSTEQNPSIVLYFSDFEPDIPYRDKFPVTLTAFNGTDSSKITKYDYVEYPI